MRQKKSAAKKNSKHYFEINFYEKILKESPNFTEALKALAELYTKTGQFRKGLELDIKITRILPKDALSHYNLACSYSLLGSINEALDTLKKAVLLGYDDFEYMNRDPDLENLRKDNRFKEIVLSVKR